MQQKLYSLQSLKSVTRQLTQVLFLFQCPLPGCDWAFTTAYKLKRHLRGHTGEKPFVVSKLVASSVETKHLDKLYMVSFLHCVTFHLSV
jgi:hypothetical protein